MRTPSSIFLCLALIAAAGCQSLGGSNAWSNKGPRATGGRDNPVSDDPWIREAGTIARTEHPAEEVNDPLGLRNFFTSEKAREIERNVGVGN